MAGCASSKVSKNGKKSDRDFPVNVNGFGYEFKDGKLCHIKTGEPFQFVVKEGDQSYNQRHYEALGEVITEEVYTLLETECNLERRKVPFDYDDEDPEPYTFIFVSSDAFTNPDKLLVLIHGSGVVRAGQWARRLIINDCLDSGTQIPFIKRAQTEGYGIVVMNTNDNRRESRKGSSRIRGSENPENHAAHVWEYYIKPSKAKHIALIAHSYGGCVTTALFQKERDDFRDKVFAVALTDSVHYISNTRAFKDLIKISCNWVSSTKPLDTPLNSMRGDIPRVSAGVNVHEQTSWSSFESVFKFLQKRYDAVTKGADAEADEGVEEGDSTVALDRKMSVGSDSALENTDVDMMDVGGEDDSLPNEENGTTTEGDKMTAEGSTEEGKEPEVKKKKADKSPEGEEDGKGNAFPDAKTTAEGDETNKSAKEDLKTGKEEGSPDVEMKETKDTNGEHSTTKGVKMTSKSSTEKGKEPKTTEEGDETDKATKEEVKTGEGEDITDAKTTEGVEETDKSEKEDSKTEERENPPDIEMAEVKDLKGAHSISDNEEEKEGEEQNKQKKD